VIPGREERKPESEIKGGELLTGMEQSYGSFFRPPGNPLRDERPNKVKGHLHRAASWRSTIPKATTEAIAGAQVDHHYLAEQHRQFPSVPDGEMPIWHWRRRSRGFAQRPGCQTLGAIGACGPAPRRARSRKPGVSRVDAGTVSSSGKWTRTVHARGANFGVATSRSPRRPG